ncbi:pectin lyase fold/virulence factor [Infundibulicybe gibba]|nr:pectin lyase fold/virulence factor [Infundibulicybe gibba]
MNLFFQLLVLAKLHLVLGLSPKFTACQTQKPSNVSPLTGCPAGTIFVSQNTGDPHAKFHSVQDAVLSLPKTGDAIILIAAGQYHETVNITRTGPLTLLGQLPASSATPVRSFANPSAPNLVQIWDNKFVAAGMDDAQSAVLLVAPSFNGSLIGAGPTGAPLQPLFGNQDFKAYNIDFQNRAANFAISQALVTDISYANASFYGCSFASFQDTWYTGRNGSTYVNVVLANRACGGGIVAWKGTNLTDAPGIIIRSPDANATAATAGLCFLGRPWNDLATTVFLRTFMDNSIRPAGWTPFGGGRRHFNTTFYAEFDSTGPGGNTSARIPLEHLLTAAQATQFTVDGVFLEHPKWIDFDYRF